MNLLIKAFEEWTWIFTQFAGISYDLHENEKLHEIESFPSSKPFFYWVDESNIKVTQRGGLISGSTHNEDVYKIDFNPKKVWKEWTPPKYSEYYGKLSPLKSEKPIIVINNKYNPEWGQQIPFNFLPLDCLKDFCEKFSDKYEILYIRYEGKGHSFENGYWDDVPSYTKEEYGDYELIKEFGIKTIYDFMNEYDEKDFNIAQMMMMSKAKHILCTAGGNAVLSSYFGEDVVIYGHPDCKSTSRGIWHTDSWLKELSGSNIIGHTNWIKMINDCENRWLD